MTEYFEEILISTAEQSNGSSLKFFQDFKFETTRVFFVRASEKGEIRGRHAHKKCKQLIYVLDGEFKISLILRNRSIIYKEKLYLNNKALLIQPNVWVELEALKNNSIFSCLCDRKYDESDYIRHSRDFFEEI